MKSRTFVRSASIIGLTMLAAPGVSLAQTEKAAEQFTLSGSCLEQAEQLSAMVARDLVDVTDSSSDGGSGWGLPGGSSEAPANETAENGSASADMERASADPASPGSSEDADAAAVATSTAQAPKETDPLVLTMADGSTVDLNGETEEALEAVPTENWFGQSPDVETANSYLASAAELARSGNEEACLESLEDAKVALGMEEAAEGSETARQ